MEVVLSGLIDHIPGFSDAIPDILHFVLKLFRDERSFLSLAFPALLALFLFSFVVLRLLQAFFFLIFQFLDLLGELVFCLNLLPQQLLIHSLKPLVFSVRYEGLLVVLLDAAF